MARFAPARQVLPRNRSRLFLLLPALLKSLTTLGCLGYLGSRGHAETFEEVTVDAGIQHNQWEPEDPDNPPRESIGMLTGGAATADSNSDGWPDLFFTRYDGGDVLLINNGDGSFTDRSDVTGFHHSTPTNGVVWTDVDNDGDPDIYTSIATTEASALPARFRFYENLGTAGYREDAENRGIDLSSSNGHSGFSVSDSDYNRDGWIDLHTCQWNPRGGTRQSVLFRNLGHARPGHFEDVTDTAGVNLFLGERSFALNSRFSDLDRDGWPDLVIAGDFETSRLFWNQGGTFVDGTQFARVATDENGMGLAIGDYDGDGLFDLFVSSIYDPSPNPQNPWGVSGNRLFRNLGQRRFVDQTDAAGVRDGAWGWGSAFFDYDNDGDLDLIVTNGYGAPFYDYGRQWLNHPTRLWRNDGEGSFTEVAHAEGIADTGSGKGVVIVDFDRDGRLDVVLVNNAGPPALYRNRHDHGNHWLRVRPVGRFSNRDAIGCTVRVTVSQKDGASRTQVREIGGGSHYLSQSERVCHFGLGTRSEAVDTVELVWPSGIRQRLTDVPCDQEILIIEPESPYQGWSEEQFPTEFLDRGPHHDPDHDGLCNAIEFSAGSDPLKAQEIAPLTVEREKQGAVLIAYRHRVMPRGLAVAVEVSKDLHRWQGAEEANFELISISQQGDLATSTLRLPAKEAPRSVWVRLRVVLTP